MDFVTRSERLHRVELEDHGAFDQKVDFKVSDDQSGAGAGITPLFLNPPEFSTASFPMRTCLI